MKIFVIRHGETDMNKAHRIQGQTEDTELNANGLVVGTPFFRHFFLTCDVPD